MVTLFSFSVLKISKEVMKVAQDLGYDVIEICEDLDRLNLNYGKYQVITVSCMLTL